MTNKKRILSLLIITLIISALLAGCIPSNYTQGVMLIEDYPIDDFPITDDAVIYYCDKDDNDVTIRYGTNEELSTVIEFYKSLFEERQITVDDERESDSRYIAEGLLGNFSFSIKATEASGEYEEKLYTTVVRVKIEFLSQMYEIQEKLIGFWRFQRDSSQSQGQSLDFIDKETVIIHDYGYYPVICEWDLIDQNTIKITFEDGSNEVLEISFETKYDKECMIWSNQISDYTYYKDLSNKGMDYMLSQSLISNEWNFVHYVYEDGEVVSFGTGAMKYNSDGTFEDEFGKTAGTWFISGGFIFSDYDNDGETIIRPIRMEDYQKVIKFLLYNDEVEHWLYINKEFRLTEPPDFSGIKWYIYSKNPNNELLVKCEGTIEFMIDHLAKYSRINNSSAENCSWYYDEEVIFLFHRDGTLLWAVDMQTDDDGNRSLSLIGLAGSEEDLSDYTITDTPTIEYIKDDTKVKSLLTVETWNCEYHIDSESTLSEMPRTTINFLPDGTFSQTRRNEELSGTWSFKDGTLHIQYPSGSKAKYPNTYIKMGSSEGTTVLMLGDGEGGFFKYTLDD